MLYSLVRGPDELMFVCHRNLYLVEYFLYLLISMDGSTLRGRDRLAVGLLLNIKYVYVKIFFKNFGFYCWGSSSCSASWCSRLVNQWVFLCGTYIRGCIGCFCETVACLIVRYFLFAGVPFVYRLLIRYFQLSKSYLHPERFRDFVEFPITTVRAIEASFDCYDPIGGWHF